MTISPIRTQDAYEAGRRRAAALAEKTDQSSKDEFEVLCAVLEAFERDKVDLPAPEPLEAIRFRMRQAGLKPRDLEPFIGSRARVSEILSGSRPLTLDMIRALHRHLGIPAASLLADAPTGAVASAAPSTAALNKLRSLGAMRAGEAFSAFLARAFQAPARKALLRKSRTLRTNAKTDQGALVAWCAAIMLQADAAAKPTGPLVRRNAAAAAARGLAELSAFPDGLSRVRDALSGLGMVIVVMEHLPGTYLDGAAMLRSDGVPVIALTLRHDRLDNFWFTLLHEFCHAARHLKSGTTLILDDLDLKGSDDIEAEADAFAQHALIPPEIWARHATADMQQEVVVEIAAEAKIHPAIVAGRWQRENSDYRRFSRLLGRGDVRLHFY